MQPQVVLHEEQLQLWANKLERETGVQLGQLQDSLLNTQIALRMRELQLEDVDTYYAKVCDNPLEWQALLARLLVKETQFFRNREALQGIQNFLVQKIQNQTLDKSFDVWSLGCATGEEAYSLAATLHDGFRLAPEPGYYSVTGLDICVKALSTARKAVYPKTRMQYVQPGELAQYFEPAEGNQFQVRSELTSRVTFVKGNLCDIDAAARMPMDVIVCLNVLIYFRRWRRRELLNKLVAWLKPGGLLIIGSGELPGWQHPELASIGISGVQAYQRL